MNEQTILVAEQLLHYCQIYGGNRMNYDEMIAVLTAAKHGKIIQRRALGYTVWDIIDSKHCGWDFDTYDYRVKPEPLVVWVNLYHDGPSTAHFSEQSAKKYALNARTNAGERVAVKFVEVLDN